MSGTDVPDIPVKRIARIAVVMLAAGAMTFVVGRGRLCAARRIFARRRLRHGGRPRR